MRVGAIGGGVVLLAVGLLVLTGALGTQGQSVVLSLQGDLASTLSFAGTALLSLGLLIIGLFEAPPLVGRLLRAGLVIGALGLGAIIASSVVAASLTFDAFENLGFVGLLLAGALAGALGFVLTVIGLLRIAGGPRLAGLLLLGGLVAAFAGGVAANEMGATTLGRVLAAGGVAAVFLGITAIGLIAIGVRRASRPAS